LKRRLKRLCAFLATGILASLNLAFPQGEALAKWATMAPFPIARGETAAARLEDRIFVAAGFNGSLSPTKEMFVYTPAKNSWQASTPLPIGLHHLGMAEAKGKLYIMGGVVNGLGGPHPNGAEWTGSATALEYDPSTSTWKSIKALPHATAASGVASFGGKIYVIGGIDADGIVLDLVQEYDPSLDAWSNKLPMPTKREHVGVTVLDSLIYVVSGRVGDQSFKKLEAFSPASNRWYTLPDMPTARSDIGFAHAKGRLYAMGGEKPGIFDANEEYNPSTRTWKSVLKMTGARKAMSAVSFNDSIFVFGGFASSGLTSLVEVFSAPGAPLVSGIGNRDKRFLDSERKDPQISLEWNILGRAKKLGGQQYKLGINNGYAWDDINL
jgi:N-acetylneuraminic acid mutarotase